MKNNNMQKEPLISVVMPTYNHGQFIKESMVSVLDQAYKNFELIIVDNYSRDDTEKIVKSFNEHRISYYKFSNKGIIAASRNFGISKSAGEYIAFIDSDDIWYPSKLEAQINVFLKEPTAGLVYSSLKIKSPDISENNKIIKPKSKSCSGDIYYQLINFDFIPSSSVIVRSLILNEVGNFDENPELVTVEDWDLWLRITRKFKAVFFPEVLGVYRMHGHNQSAKNKRFNKAICVVNKHFENGLLSERLANRAKANMNFREGWFSIAQDPKKARSLLRKALFYGKGNLKIYFVSIITIFLSYVPFLYKFIRRKSFDRRIATQILNPQNL